MNDQSSSPPPSADGESARPSLGRSLRDWFRKLTGSRNGENTARDVLEELIEEREEDPIDDDERVLLANILELRDRTIHDVMVPRADIVAVEAATSLDEVIDAITREGHSRLPVYRETLDDAVGMVHIKDVLPWQGVDRAFSLAEILCKILFVSPSMQVTELLLEMRVKRSHMALVVDEFGGTDGLVTIEDLVEEIVGEIEDEHDRDLTPALTANPDGSFQADGRVPVEALETKAGLALLSDEADEEIETLGGLVFSLVGRVPRSGERIAHPCGSEFEVLDADPRRIKREKIRMPRLVDEEGAGAREPGAETGTRGPLAEK